MIIIISSWLRTAAITLAVLAISIGCTPKKTPIPITPPAGWPDSASDFTVEWTGEPGIDLTFGAAVVVRAYMESYYLAHITGDNRFLYPGFQQSVDADDPSGPDGTHELWPDTNSPDTWVGTFQHHLLRVEQSGRDVMVVGCVYTGDSGGLVGDGLQPHRGGLGPAAAVSTFRVMLHTPEGDQPSLPAQHGPSRAPFDNVFDGWRVTNFQGGYLLLAHWEGNYTDKQACMARYGDAARNSKLVVGATYPKSAFPVLPAVPGWPARSKS